MVIRLTDKTITIAGYHSNEHGYYGVPYPAENYYHVTKDITATLTNRTYSGLTLARINGLEDKGRSRLGWVLHTK